MKTIWEGRWIIAVCTIVASVGAVTYALLAKEIYRSEALVQPREDSSAPAWPGALAQLGGLASFDVALGLGGGRAVAVATLKSRALIEQFIEDNRILPKLYASEWDTDTGKWRSDDPKKVPTVWQAYNDFTERVLKVTEDKKTGLVTVAIEWTDPQEAQMWVTEIIGRTNGHLRRRAIEEGEKNLAYLQAQSKATGQVELQRALYGLVEAELKRVMLAKGGDEYALKIVDPAAVPRKRFWPRRAAISVLGFALGALLGAAIVVVRDRRRLK